MKWLNAVLKTAFNRHMKKVQHAIEHPQETQANVWKQLLRQGARTQWGKAHGLAIGQSLEQVKERVPVQSYESLYPSIQRMLHGESNVLCPGKVRQFSRSSGTTSQRSKYLPVPIQNLKGCHLRGLHDTVAVWIHNNPHSCLFHNRRSIVMGGSIELFDAQAKTQVGDVSALMVDNSPFYGAPFITPDVSTALLANWEEKIERIANIAVHQNIGSLSGVPTWTLVLLRRLLELSGKDNLSEVFPNLEVYNHGGVDFAPYRSQFEALFPNHPIGYRNNYNASEGFFATQFLKEDSGMHLLVDNGVFYEFIPREDWQAEHPRTLSLEEVEVGVDYALVVSTNAGLWRYKIGDTLQFTARSPYQIKITGRTQQYINVFGEEVMVWNAEQALHKTCQVLDARISDFTVAPIFMQHQTAKGGHEWAIEFEQFPKDITRFQTLLDQHLQMVNSDYHAKRQHNLALQELHLNVVPKGTFHRWLRQHNKYGGQHKVPRLSNKRQVLEEILALSNGILY
ncbi:MAG: GH3 auxin-responsive promoter family protein [Aureispira sp.]